VRGHPPQHDLLGAHERRQRAHRVRQAGEHRLSIEAIAAGRRWLTRRAPRLEVQMADFQSPLAAVTLGVHATHQLSLVENRQRVVPVHALVARRVDLDPVVVAEQPRHALAKPQQRIERRQERRAL